MKKDIAYIRKFLLLFFVFIGGLTFLKLIWVEIPGNSTDVEGLLFQNVIVVLGVAIMFTVFGHKTVFDEGSE